MNVSARSARPGRRGPAGRPGQSDLCYRVTHRMRPPPATVAGGEPNDLRPASDTAITSGNDPRGRRDFADAEAGGHAGPRPEPGQGHGRRAMAEGPWQRGHGGRAMGDGPW